ncbi:hypothetical protein EJB05_53640, partial [Eragrostis curvula]
MDSVNPMDGSLQGAAPTGDVSSGRRGSGGGGNVRGDSTRRTPTPPAPQQVASPWPGFRGYGGSDFRPHQGSSPQNPWYDSSARRRRANEHRRAAVPSYPRSALVYFYGERDDNVDSCPAADAKTTAAARSTTGHPFRVSFHFAPPPAVSLMIAGFPDDGDKKHGCPVVLAAHGDSVLFKMYFADCTTDHFIYNAGSPSSRPPTVSLLPPNYLTRDELEKLYRYSHRRLRGPVNQNLNDVATGFLRRGEDEFVVAELKMVVISEEEPEKKVAELLMFRSGEWTRHRPTMMASDGGNVDVEDLLSKWETRSVLPFRDGLLCWLDISCGLLFCNAFDEIPTLRFMRLPENRNVSITADGGAVKFVNIFLRCCCGGSGATMCDRCIHAYTIHTWILRIQDMASWEMDGIVDSTEIWALDGYKGLPRVQLVQARPLAGTRWPTGQGLQIFGASNLQLSRYRTARKKGQIQLKSQEKPKAYLFGEAKGNLG